MTELPPGLANLVVLALGLIVGSFLNVVIARVPLGQSVVKPRSRCPGCGKDISWYDNIPVLSWLILAGKCRKCRKPISVRYPVIELLTALLFLAAKHRFGWSYLLFVRDFPFVSILVAITFIDLEHRIIPDRLSLGGLVLGLATSFLAPELDPASSFIGAALGFSIFYALAWIYLKSTGRSGLGGGDIKLLAMLGAFVGPMGVLISIFVSSLFGSVAGIGWAYATRKERSGEKLMTVAIPYGPFLVVGGLYFYLLHDVLWPRFMIPT